MADEKLQQKLIDYVEDAHAMEQSVSTMLDSMISTTDDPEIRSMLEHHKQETEEHERRLRERLGVLGAGTSTPKEAHNPKGEMFGFPRPRALVAEHGEEMSLGDLLLEELYSFVGDGWEQEDDITLLTLQRSARRS